MPILDKWTLDFISSSTAQTERLGVRLGELLTSRDVLCFSGELGAGKTVLARGVGRGWGTSLRVTSPTFTLINEYPRARDGRILYHIDCYRLESSGEIATVGLEDVLYDGDGAVMIEWPERIESYLPADMMWVAITYLNETRRSLRFTAKGDRAATLLEKFKHSAFGV